ncbi:MAG TPA: metallophosphoesterase [Chloroflexia bacterium]|nr:metallophosphoesterase [Chloroflexia bacterium]
MTRVAVLADIHGNLPALEAVARDLGQFRVDHVVVAGDLVNWGPYSEQVLEFVTKRGWSVIRGNHEFYLLDYGTPRAPTEWQDRTQYPMPPWLRKQLAGKWQTTLAAWPDALTLQFPDAPPVRVVHGSTRSHWEGIYPHSSYGDVKDALQVEEPVLVAAHTHLHMDRVLGDRHVMNPGSVGVPLDGIFGASYLVMAGTLGGWQATFRRVPFEYEPLFREFERLRFVEECGVVGELVVAEFRTARPQVHPFMVWRKRHHPDVPLSAQLLAEFYKVDQDEYNPPAYRLESLRSSLVQTGG